MKKKIFGIYPRDEEKFAGEYLAVVKNKILAHGKQLKSVVESIKNFTGEPLLVKVPALGWERL